MPGCQRFWPSEVFCLSSTWMSLLSELPPPGFSSVSLGTCRAAVGQCSPAQPSPAAHRAVAGSVPPRGSPALPEAALDLGNPESSARLRKLSLLVSEH